MCCIENSSNSSDGLVDICYARNTPGLIYSTNIRKMVLCQGLPHCLRRPMCRPMHGMSCPKFQLTSTCLNLANITGRTALAVRLYVPTCIHLFPHARTDTIQVVEHEPNFSKFYPLTISFLVSQFCTLESSLCVSSSDYYLISPFGTGSSLIKVVLNLKIRTTECTPQTTVSTQNELMIDNNVDLCTNPIIDRLGTKELNTRAIQ